MKDDITAILFVTCLVIYCFDYTRKTKRKALSAKMYEMFEVYFCTL